MLKFRSELLIDKDQTVRHHNKVALSQLADWLVYVYTDVCIPSSIHSHVIFIIPCDDVLGIIIYKPE